MSAAQTPNYIPAQEGAEATHQEPSHFSRPHRTPGQLELGVTEIIEDRGTPRNVVASAGISESHFRRQWESYKPEWLAAGIAEMFGVFFYVYAGTMATATYVLTSAAGSPQGSLTMIGFAYGFGIAFAILVCATTSGGHFHPAISIAQWLFKGFPARKVPVYIFWQLLGGFIASLLCYLSYRDEMQELAAALRAAGKAAQIFTPQGPAGIIAIFPEPNRSLRSVFANEFFGDFVLGLVIWANLDSANPFNSPVAAPFSIGLAFTIIVWGWSTGTIVTNTARDLGARFACGAIWGSECFPAKYSALAALTNIPATLFAVAVYTFFLSDSRRPPAQLIHEHHLASEKAKFAAAQAHHDRILTQRISRTVTRGKDASALEARLSRMDSAGKES